MKKLLFLSNGSKPSEDDYNYIGEEKLSNFSIPIVNVAQSLGVEVTVGVNRRYAEQLTCMYPVSFYDAQIYRNPFNLMEIYQAYKNACAEISKGGYSVVHCNTPIGGVVGRIAGRKFKLKVVYTAHGFHFYKGAPKKNWLVYYPVEKWLAHYTDALITINNEDFELAKTKLKLRNNGKVYFVPGVGVETNVSKLSTEERIEKRKELGLFTDDFVIVSVGRLESNKNNRTLIHAISQLDNPNIKLILCGDGSEMTDLKALTKSLSVDDRVLFLGVRNDMAEIYEAVDVLAMASFREGLSRTIMEAMSHGLPCIVSNIRGNVDLIENMVGGFLCKTTDASAYAEKINLLANDKVLREKMAKNNLHAIKKYSIETVTEKIREIYNVELS